MGVRPLGGALRAGFGYRLPNCAGVECQPALATPGTILELARHARDRGFDALWLHDHLATPDELRHLERPAFYEPVVLLAHLAAALPGIDVGVATVVLPLRDPVVFAKQLATLESLHPGRVVAGIGVGRFASEFRSLGLDTFHARGRVTDEYLDIVRALLGADAPVDHAGGFRRLEGASFCPAPGAGHPPLWIGGNVGATIARAARAGDGWAPTLLPGMSPATVREDCLRLADLLDASGRYRPEDYPVALNLTVIPPSAAAAGGSARGLHGMANVVRGSAAEVVETLAAYRDAGVSSFTLSLRADTLAERHESIDWFAEGILAAFPRQ